MWRSLVILLGLCAPVVHAYPPVLPGPALQFPRDFGAHPEHRTEWWYATGWLTDEDGVERGFQVTFFRVRTRLGEDDGGRFAPRQLVLAHAAVSDPAVGRLVHAERSARALAPLAGADTDSTRAWIDDWRLELQGETYRTTIVADDFGFDLELRAGRPPLLNGRDGYSQKAPDPLNASWYYSRPQLTTRGTLRLNGETHAVSGTAWLDHEWSSEILPADASGWDWVGINLHDGGSLMAFRMRDLAQSALWGAATLADASGDAETFDPDEVRFSPRRHWRSPRSGTEYGVEWDLRVGERYFRVEPLMDDQELDSSASTGAIYWEGAVRLFEGDAEVGRGYLEMTGYRERLRM